MNSRLTTFTIAMVMLCAHFSANAYELGTHARLTYKAYENSVLKEDDQLIDDLGIGHLDPDNPFGTQYYDVSGSNVRVRNFTSFETRFMAERPDNPRPALPWGNNPLPLSLPGWLLRGAIREDDVMLFWKNPQDDPYGNFMRVLHHFYDPINDTPLEGYLVVDLCESIPWDLCAGTDSAKRALTWATGASDPFGGLNTADPGRRNHFTVFDAREAMYRAVTGRDRNGSVNIGPGGTPADESVRKAYWATTFRALGDVLHLLQDMAQPQHTRNDIHLPPAESSVYEAYTDARARGQGYQCFNSNDPIVSILRYDGKNPVSFENYTDFFSTRDETANVPARMGLADYSNRGFFSEDTNIGSDAVAARGYVYPSTDPAAYNKQAIVYTKPCVNRFTEVDLFQATVPDPVFGSSTNVPITSYGLWKVGSANPAISQALSKVQYGLSEYNYQAMGDELIPRAVAYGAGLLDYFFRGRMEIKPPNEGIYGIVDHSVAHSVSGGIAYTTGGAVYGFTKIKLKLRNTTPDITPPGGSPVPQAMTGGTLLAVAKYRPNTCYTPDLSGEFTSKDDRLACTAAEQVAVSVPIPVSSVSATTATAFTFDFSADPIPINATNLFLQIVYRGVLGSEQDAVVLATKDLSEPTFISQLNATDYFLVNGTFYTPQYIQAHIADAVFSSIDRDDNDQYNPPADVDVDPWDLAYSFGFGGATIASVTLPPARYCRFAALLDVTPFTLTVNKLSFGYAVFPGYEPRKVQTGELIQLLSQFRGYYRFINLNDWRFVGSTSNGDTSIMLELSDPTPFPVAINF